MPTRLTPRHKLPYFLLCVDKSGAECPEEDGSLLSERILAAVRATDPKVTDVFVMSHGWKGDVDSAIEQYDRWIDVMGDCTDDRARAREVRPGFTPLLVGFHWPSLPFGEEGMGGNAFDTAPGAGEDAFVDLWAERTADTPAARAALHTLFAAALDDLEPERLSAAVIGAYQTLDREAGLGTGGPAAAPEADRAGFDPQQLYLDAADAEASFGGGFLGGLLSPLRELSWWTMKRRARGCGETGGYRLVAAIRAAGGDTVPSTSWGTASAASSSPRCSAVSTPCTRSASRRLSWCKAPCRCGASRQNCQAVRQHRDGFVQSSTAIASAVRWS